MSKLFLLGSRKLEIIAEAFNLTNRVNYNVSIKHLETGAEIGVRAEESFPLASAFKLPILVEVYAQQRAGR